MSSCSSLYALRQRFVVNIIHHIVCDCATTRKHTQSYPGIGDPLPGFVHGGRDGLVPRIDAGDTHAAGSGLEVRQKVLRSYVAHMIWYDVGKTLLLTHLSFRLGHHWIDFTVLCYLYTYITSSSAIAEGPRDGLSPLKSCQLLHNCTKIHVWLEGLPFHVV